MRKMASNVPWSADEEFAGLYGKASAQMTADLMATLSNNTQDTPHTAIDKKDRSIDHVAMNSPTREEFEARIETVEARMDTRVAKIESKIDQYVAVSSERDAYREKLQAERDKRIDLLVERAAQSAEKAEGLKSTLWVTTITTIVAVALAVVGTTISSFYATQSSNLAIVQTTISAFQQGQNTPPKK